VVPGLSSKYTGNRAAMVVNTWALAMAGVGVVAFVVRAIVRGVP
jgi:hypothetical protein